jgi:hypothetical protein
MKPFAGILTIVLSAILLSTGCTKPDTPESPDVKVSGVSLSKQALSLTVGDSDNLTAVVVPADAANKNVAWSSDDNSIATVDGTGKVSARKAGKAVITVTTADGGKTANCTVTVTPATVAVTDVTLDEKAVTISAEDKKTLTATVIPATATNKKITWSSSDPSVATVGQLSGTITGVKAGKAVITCTTDDAAKTAVCTVTVEAPDPDNLLRAAYIPDPVFLDYCRKQMDDWDTNGDGKLYAGEAAAVTSIYVANINGNVINSLKGIEYFTGLTYLDCSLNNLSSLDVSRCPRLIELYCNHNGRLSSLRLSEYTALTILDCSACSLTSLDLSKCTRLAELSCFFNDLTSLDVSKCTALRLLDVDGNKLTKLNLSNNRALSGLICDNNSLVSLDLSQCVALTSLDCYNNSLASLDLSRNAGLIYLSCDRNSLVSLDISKNTALESLVCNGNELSSITIGRSNARLSYIHSSSNRMSSASLNAVFEALPASGTIAIYDNPGTATCDVSIAESKNWTVKAE